MYVSPFYINHKFSILTNKIKETESDKQKIPIRSVTRFSVNPKMTLFASRACKVNSSPELKASVTGKKGRQVLEPAIEGNAIIINIKNKRRLQKESSVKRAALTNVLNNFHLHRTGKMTTKKGGYAAG